MQHVVKICRRTLENMSQEHKGTTTGFSPCFHLPGCHVGVTLFLTHSHMLLILEAGAWTPESAQVLEQNPAAQRKLETLYRLCMKDLLSTERIYQLISRYPNLATQFYADFRKIALGAALSSWSSGCGRRVVVALREPERPACCSLHRSGGGQAVALAASKYRPNLWNSNGCSTWQDPS